jgi:hypothetical protein
VAPADSAKTKQVVCFASPWQDAVLINLTKELPLSDGNKGSATDEGWALELSNSDRCVFGTGANGIVKGVVMNYYCQSGAVAGGIDTKSKQWVIQYDKKGTKTLTTVDVTAAWTIKN